MPKGRGSLIQPGPKPLQVGKLDDAIKRFFEIRGGMPLHLLPSVVPVITGRELLEPPWNLLEGGLIGASPAGVVGQYGYVFIGPVTPNANEVLIIDEVKLSAVASLLVQIGWGSVLAGTTQTGYFSDTRTGALGSGIGSQANVRAEYGANAAAWAGTTIARVFTPANQAFVEVPGVFVNGGNNPSPALGFYTGQTNAQMTVMARFRIYRVSQ